MFKNLFKRAWLSVVRKPSRSIIIALILFAMSALVFATITIETAVDQSMAYAKASLGGTVSLQPDMEALRAERKPDQADKNSAGTGQATEQSASVPTPFERPAVRRALADQIASSSYVQDYSYSLSTVADSDTLEPVEQSSNAGGFGGGRPGQVNNSNSNNSDFTISGINAYAFIDEVQNNTMTIQSGDYFDEADNDAAIISVDLAEANDLAVGDHIKLINTSTDQTVKLSVIGIYDSSSPMTNANAIYMNIPTAAQFLSESDYNDGDYTVDQVSYQLVNAEQADAFIAEITENYPELAEQNIVAEEDTALYQQMVGPIESVGSFAAITRVVVIIAAVIIITLIITINIKDRRYEIGVLLSLGASKVNIIGQILVELLLVGTVAFIAGALTSSLVADSIGQSLLESQISASETQAANNFGRPGTVPGGGNSMPLPENTSDANSESIPPSTDSTSQDPDSAAQPTNTTMAIDQIDVQIRPLDFLLLFLCGYGVILLALLIPTVNVLRYQPKTILQGKE